MKYSHPIAKVVTYPRVVLFIVALLVYGLQIVTWDCNFCFYFRTPVGVTSLLLPAALLLWLRFPGLILAMALSFFAVALAISNILRQRTSALMDYGPDRWVQPAFAMSWGYLLAILISIAIVWYALFSLWRSTGRDQSRNAT